MKINKKMGWIIIAAITLMVSLAWIPIFTPRIEGEKVGDIWDVSVQQQQLTVFGFLTLQQSTLAEAVSHFGNRYDVGIFEDATGTKTLEAYFRETEVGRLTGRVIAHLDASAEDLALAISLAGKAKQFPDRITRYLIPQDQLAPLFNQKIKTLAFIPTAVNFDEALVTARFGTPTAQLTEKSAEDGEIAHYLYPERGIDIAINPAGRTIVQYVPPALFEQWVVQPLQAGK